MAEPWAKLSLPLGPKPRLNPTPVPSAKVQIAAFIFQLPDWAVSWRFIAPQEPLRVWWKKCGTQNDSSAGSRPGRQAGRGTHRAMTSVSEGHQTIGK